MISLNVGAVLGLAWFLESPSVGDFGAGLLVSGPGPGSASWRARRW